MSGRSRKASAPRPHGASGVTIRHVAAEAGVSIATVSHVLNRTRPVSPELRNRVTDAASRLNFRPSPSARGLRLGHGALVELVAPAFSGSYARAARAAAEESQRRGSRLTLTLSTPASSGEADRRRSWGDPTASDDEPESLPLPVDASIYFGEPDTRRRAGAAISVTCGVDDGAPAATDRVIFPAAKAASMLAKHLLRGRCGPLALLWLTDPSCFFARPLFARAAEIGILAALRRFGLGRLSLTVIRTDPAHLQESARVVREAEPAGVIVNSVRALTDSLNAPAGFLSGIRLASLDDDAEEVFPSGCGAVVRWDWEAAGRHLVRAALGTLSPERAATPLSAPFRVELRQAPLRQSSRAAP